MLLPKLALAAEKGKKFDGDRQNLTALFTLAIIGFGAFSYFVGRSYPTNVFVLIYVSVLIVALLIVLNLKSKSLCLKLRIATVSFWQLTQYQFHLKLLFVCLFWAFQHLMRL